MRIFFFQPDHFAKLLYTAILCDPMSKLLQIFTFTDFVDFVNEIIMLIILSSTILQIIYDTTIIFIIFDYIP